MVLVRHGQSTGNVERLWTSQREKYPLTDVGRRQAAGAATALEPLGIDTVFTSWILRARQTAAVIASRLSVPVREVDGLEELHVGIHEGGHDDDVAPVAASVFRGWLVDGDLSHGFEGGETGYQIAHRFATALNRIADEHLNHTVAAVSHGGAMALGLAVMCPNLSPEFVGSNLLDNCARVEVVRDISGWRCVSWADMLPG